MLGDTCIICELKDPTREHVSRHFMKELLEFVSLLDDKTQCPGCNYRGDKPQNLARHVALVHSKLDELLMDQELVQARRAEQMSKPEKVQIGNTCPICDAAIAKQHARVHVIWHFIEELREVANGFQNPMVRQFLPFLLAADFALYYCFFCLVFQSCDICNDYTNPNIDKVAKHLALGHSMLDKLLADKALVAEKRSKATARPKKENVGPICPVCSAREPTREHVARHFSDELLMHVMTLPDHNQCASCPYRGDKPKTLGIHISLVHGMLDQ